MPRRKFPSPEEYGRRLADAKRRAEKQSHEKARQTADSFTRVLGELNAQKAALAAVGTELATLPRDVLAPGDMERVVEDLLERLTAIHSAILAIDLVVPEPELPESLTRQLDELLQLANRPIPTPAPPKVDPAVPLDSPQTIFEGPITLRVTDRDGNGDIETVQVKPTRH